MPKKLLIICGPTATGKTALGLTLAKEFNGEIVSADSRQVYRGMDIGTGKDLPEKLKVKSEKLKIGNSNYTLPVYNIKEIPVWLYDIVRPDQEFNVSNYQKIACNIIEDIINRKKLPVIVGGTGLYINSLINPFDTQGIPPDKKLRQKLNKADVSSIQNILKQKYPDTWSCLNDSDKLNPRRLIRKLEINNYLSNTPSVQNNIQKNKFNNDIQYLIIGLTAGLKSIYKKIDQRVDERVQQGILNEIKSLLKSGYKFNLQSMSALGYKQWRIWFENPKLQNEKLKNEIISRWKFAEHAYARRQMTWFKKQSDIKWFSVENQDYVSNITKLVKSWYTK